MASEGVRTRRVRGALANTGIGNVHMCRYIANVHSGYIANVHICRYIAKPALGKKNLD